MASPINCSTSRNNPVLTVPIHILDNATPSLETLTSQLLEAYTQSAEPEQFLVLLPSAEQERALRELLTRHPQCPSALQLPTIKTLEQWAENAAPLNKKILNNHARQLMLVEVLQNSDLLLGKGSAWQLADELLTLFDLLELSGQTPQSLETQIQKLGLSHFEGDAAIVSTLWQARREQMAAEDATDRPQIYRQGLSTLLQSPPETKNIFIAGYDTFQGLELTLIERLLERPGITHLFVENTSPALTALLHSNKHTLSTPADRNLLGSLLDSIFLPTPPLRERTLAWKKHVNPASKRLLHFAASNPESEVQMASLQARLWLAEGVGNVGVITEDRRFARRLSAVLANSGISAQDQAGWPLSTTVAAGTLERWFECIETDFNHRHLLDVLKSPFVKAPSLADSTIFTFERDIVEREQVGSNLSAYRASVDSRAERLTPLQPEFMTTLHNMLTTIEEAAAPLVRLHNSDRQPATNFLDSLEESLKKLCLWQGLEIDPAGQRITQEILDMRQSLANRQLKVSWSEFRAWFGRTLETHNFRPDTDASRIIITNLAQTRLKQFDRVIIAGADAKHLPAPPGRMVFFNESILHGLGLATWQENQELVLHRFRRLIEATQETLISYTWESEGNPLSPSPWLARIQAFVRQAFGSKLAPPSAAAWMNSTRIQATPTLRRKPPLKSSRAEPCAPQALLTTRLSANAHQTLIDCPYRFFSQYSLGLRATEEIIEQLNKAEVGTLIHRCLEAFHSDVQGLPGPIPLNLLTPEHRSKALQLLEDISRTVFDERNTEELREKQWLEQWLETIPYYLDWQIRGATSITDIHTEQKRSSHVGSAIELFGTIDRLDQTREGVRIIDYKTGLMPKAKEQLAGEKVQLLSYALLTEKPPAAITYLPLKPEPVKPVELSGTELDELLPDIEQRLKTLAAHLSQQGPLPANGVDNTCQYCQAQGLCRKEALDEQSMTQA